MEATENDKETYMSQEQECGVIDTSKHCKGNGKGIGALVTVVQGCDECGCEAAEKTASDALKAAEEAQKSADAAGQAAQEARKSADEADRAAHEAQKTADAANQAAQEAQKAADAAAERAAEAYEKALGYYTVDPEIRDLNTIFTVPEKRWLTHLSSVNAPYQAGFPAYFEVRLNSDRTSAMQVFRSEGADAVTWIRFAAVDRTNPQSPTSAWTGWRTETKPDGMSTVVNADGSVSVQLQDDGGLGVGGRGLYVNPDTLSEEALAGLLKHLRLQKWLTADTTFYVRTDGSDSNDGLTNSAGGAFRTIQGAINHVVSNYNMDTHQATISVQPGTYDGFTLVGYSATTGTVMIKGAATDDVIVSSVNSSTIKDRPSSGTWFLQYMTVNTTINSSSTYSLAAITATQGTTINCYYMAVNIREQDSDSPSLSAINAQGGTINLRNNMSFNATSGAASGQMRILNASVSGTILMSNPFSVNGTVQYVASAQQLGTIRKSGYLTVTVSGTVTGQRYSATFNSVIATRGGANFFPGTIAGTTATGGQYS